MPCILLFHFPVPGAKERNEQGLGGLEDQKEVRLDFVGSHLASADNIAQAEEVTESTTVTEVSLCYSVGRQCSIIFCSLCSNTPFVSWSLQSPGGWEMTAEARARSFADPLQRWDFRF